MIKYEGIYIPPCKIYLWTKDTTTMYLKQNLHSLNWSNTSPSHYSCGSPSNDILLCMALIDPSWPFGVLFIWKSSSWGGLNIAN